MDGRGVEELAGREGVVGSLRSVSASGAWDGFEIGAVAAAFAVV